MDDVAVVLLREQGVELSVVHDSGLGDEIFQLQASVVEGPWRVIAALFGAHILTGCSTFVSPGGLLCPFTVGGRLCPFVCVVLRCVQLDILHARVSRIIVYSFPKLLNLLHQQT